MSNRKYYLFVFITLISCSSAKQDYNVINGFLEADLSGKSIDTLFVSREELSKNELLLLYETAYNERNGKEKLAWVLPKIDNWPLDSLDVEKEKSIANENNNWRNSDFKNKNYIIEDLKIMRSIPFSQKHIDGGNYVLNISRPVYSKDKNSCMFLYGISCIFGGGCLTENYGHIVMEKKKSMWVQVSNIKYQVYY